MKLNLVAISTEIFTVRVYSSLPGWQRRGGARKAAAPMKKLWGLAPPKIICSCIQDTLIEQSRSRYSNRVVTVFLENQCGKFLYAFITASLAGGENCC